jgi:hypothetical protein
MQNNFTKVGSFLFGAVLFSVFTLVATQPASAQSTTTTTTPKTTTTTTPKAAATTTTPKAAASDNCDTVAGICFPKTELPKTSVEGILSNFLKWLLGIFSVLAIISFTIAGIQYFMAAGDENQAKNAKKNMQLSIIGVLVAFSALVIIYAIGNFLSAAPTF